VRDLLLDRTPKDYDIATAARPPQVKRTFARNCRIIGRRFKLAHLHFHRNTKILECSTFRRTPQASESDGDGDGGEDLLITRDNEFGNAEEDALRRDFTINALFLDPTQDKIVDHVDGLADIDARVIRTIGEPAVRFREDPVRILRAAKFAGRLGFDIEEATLAAMAETSKDLVRAAPPRVLEEILRLLRSGHALRSFQLLQEVHAVEHLIPVVGEFLKAADDEQQKSFWALLQALDEHVQAQPTDAEPPANGVLLAVLLYEAVAAERLRQPKRSASSVAEGLLGSLAVDLRLPRRDSGCLKRACGVQHRFAQDEDQRRFRVESFLHSPYFEESLMLFELRTRAIGGDLAVVKQWQDLGAANRPTESNEDAEAAPRKRRRSRRRRRDDEDDDRRSRASEATDDKAYEADTDQAQEAPRPRKRSRPRRAVKADTPSAETDDLSDVTFPSDEPPEAHATERARDEERADEDAEVADEGVTLSDVTLEDYTFEDDEKDEDDGPPRRRRRGRRGRGRRRGRDDADTDRGEASSDAEEKTSSSRRSDTEPKSAEKKNRSRRDGKRTDARKDRKQRPKKSRGGVRSDVGVVPRYRDRRGKVEVIEPVAQDLSAFDVELDPKRVPTFGSIVEGKSRPKRRGPRLTNKGTDDYRPPPPPGTDSAPSSPPPAPAADDDTFGDW